MALVKCDDCGHEVSTEAVACPNCGRPMNAAPAAGPAVAASPPPIWPPQPAGAPQPSGAQTPPIWPPQPEGAPQAPDPLTRAG
jgi:hypothetical protein